MRASGWAGRRERTEGGQWRMGSSVVVGLVALVVDEGVRGCCWVGRVNSVIVRLRSMERGRVGIGGRDSWRKLFNSLPVFFWLSSVKSDIV